MTPDRKQEILNAAKTCFMQYGFDKTTLDDIGSIVGMNKASLYYYFTNKEAILVEVISREAAEYNLILEGRIAAISGWREKILGWIEEGFRFGQSNGILHLISMDTLKKLTPQLEASKVDAQRKGSDFLASILEEGQRAGKVKACDAIQVANVIQTVIYAMKNAAYRQSRTNMASEADVRGMVREIVLAVSLMLDGLGIPCATGGQDERTRKA